MQNIQSLIDNLFADSRRSIEDLSAGFLAHNALFQAVADKNKVLKPNQLRSQQLATELTGYNTAIGSAQARQQLSRRLTAGDQQLALTRLAGTHAALAPANDYVVADAAERARLLQLLYPQGLGVFGDASLTALPDLLRTFLDLVQDAENNVPALIVTRTLADLTPFATTRETQQARQQTTDEARTKRRALLPRLEEQLTRNLHALCFLFEDDRSVVATYFDARYFEAQPAGRAGRHEGRVDAHRTNQVLSLADAPARYARLHLTVAEERPLYFYRADDPRAPAPAQPLAVAKATPLTLDLAALPGTGALLLVANPGAYVGHYVAELLPPAG